MREARENKEARKKGVEEKEREEKRKRNATPRSEPARLVQIIGTC